jgi:hypothetical protein
MTRAWRGALSATQTPDRLSAFAKGETEWERLTTRVGPCDYLRSAQGGGTALGEVTPPHSS